MSLNPRGNQQNTLDSNLDELRLANGNTSPMPKAQDLGLKSPHIATSELDSALPSNTAIFSSQNQRTIEGNAESSQTPQNTQTQTKEILANDLPETTPEPKDEPKPYATTKQRKLALNAGVINAINAENADEALDFLATQKTNISWDLVNEMRKNGTKSSEILAGIAKESAQNPRALWIDLQTPLNKRELAQNRYKYERSQITQDELDSLKEVNKLFSTNTLADITGLDFLRSKEAEKDQKSANLALQKFAEQGYEYDALPKEAQELLKKRGADSSLTSIYSVLSGTSAGKLAYDELKNEAKIYHKIKNKEALNEQDKDYIDKWGQGAGFGNETEKQQQWLMKYEAQNIIPAYAQSAIFALENKSDYKALIFGSGEGKEKDKAKFNEGIKGVALLSGFDDGFVDEKSGDIMFEKDGYLYQVNTRFLDNFSNLLKSNAFSIAGSIAGATQGFKTTKNFYGIVGGGALGAFVGGTLDGIFADIYTKNKINFAENLRHGLHEGIFNIAGDFVAAGVIKGGKYALKGVKSATPQGIKDGLASVVKGTKAFTNKIMEYSLVGQFAKNVFDGNAQSVRKMLYTQIPSEEREALKKGIKDFGLELELNPKSNTALNDFMQKYGEKYPHLATSAQKIYDIFSLPAGKELQTELLSAMRADNSGSLYGFLVEVANSSPALQKSLHDILNQTHARAINHLKSFGLKQNDIAEVFNAYKKGTQEAYTQAFEMLQELFKNEKIKVSRSNYDFLTKELKESALDEKELNYLKTLEGKIYGQGENGSERTFDNLKDALSLLNEKWGKHAKNMNFTAEKLRRVEKQMRDDIKQGINEIFSQSDAGLAMRELFDTALLDYGNMKGILKDVDRLKIRDTNLAYQKSLDKMLDFLIAGEKGEASNLAKLTAHLPKEQKIKFELATLNHLLEKSIFRAKNGDNKVLEVLNSGEFLSRLESIAGDFSTPQAKEYIDFIKEFHSLFKNDYAISQATLAPAIVQKMGGGIATTPQGRFEYQRAKFIYDSIIRLMPQIPFFSNFNEKISAAAVRFHLKSALRKSHSISELRRTLDFKLKNGNFNNPTKEVIAKILSNTEQAQETILKDLNNIESGGNEVKTESLANNRQQPVQVLDDESISQIGQRQEKEQQKLINEINPNELNDEQRGIYEVFSGQKDKIILQGKDLNDLYTL
ncbi:hypothetical protein, partial [Helicobacter sp. T3_23-1059]